MADIMDRELALAVYAMAAKLVAARISATAAATSPIFPKQIADQVREQAQALCPGIKPLEAYAFFDRPA